jgi:nickel superoxide dismutase
MKKAVISSGVGFIIIMLVAASAAAHCEIPCGIYDDGLRIKLISEHIATVEKSIKQITALGKEQPVNYNQIVRWTTNKEAHANEIQHIVAQYFLTQRIKPDAARYNEKLAVLHKMLVYAMKCKQSTDLSNVTALQELLKGFETLYFGHRHD